MTHPTIQRAREALDRLSDGNELHGDRRSVHDVLDLAERLQKALDLRTRPRKSLTCLPCIAMLFMIPIIAMIYLVEKGVIQ